MLLKNMCVPDHARMYGYRRVDEVSRGGSSLLATDEDLPEDLAEVEKGRVFYLLSPQVVVGF